MSERFDDVVVGAGIMGLAHAYHLARAGRRVIVFERHPFAQSASIRNFGMLWPIGQPAGELRALAMRSRDLWLDVAEQAGLWRDPVGSLHLAYHDDERQVLEEFVSAAASDAFACRVVDARDVAASSPLARTGGLHGALWSPNEVIVDPRQAVSRLPAWLAWAYGVRFEFGTSVTRVELPCVVAGGRTWHASRVWICGGDDLHTLFPSLLQGLGLVRCKLQMMRTRPIGQRIGPALAAGLTLRHYRSFAACPSLPALERRLAAELPEYGRFGIHVLVSQREDGALTVGDSHEYGDQVTPFDNPAIDHLVLEYLSRFLDVDVVPQAMAARWHGVYVKHPTEPYCVLRPAPETTIVTALGGAGMTLSFGLAERTVAAVLAGDGGATLRA